MNIVIRNVRFFSVVTFVLLFFSTVSTHAMMRSRFAGLASYASRTSQFSSNIAKNTFLKAPVMQAPKTLPHAVFKPSLLKNYTLLAGASIAGAAIFSGVGSPIYALGNDIAHANKLAQEAVAEITRISPSYLKDILSKCDIEHANKLAQAAAVNITKMNTVMLKHILDKCDASSANNLAEAIEANITIVPSTYFEAILNKCDIEHVNKLAQAAVANLSHMDGEKLWYILDKCDVRYANNLAEIVEAEITTIPSSYLHAILNKCDIEHVNKLVQAAVANVSHMDSVKLVYILDKCDVSYANRLAQAAVAEIAKISPFYLKDILSKCDIEHVNKLAQAAVANVSHMDSVKLVYILDKCDVSYANKLAQEAVSQITRISPSHLQAILNKCDIEHANKLAQAAVADAQIDIEKLGYILDKCDVSYANNLAQDAEAYITTISSSYLEDILKRCDIEHANKLAQAAVANITKMNTLQIGNILDKCDVSYANAIAEAVIANITTVHYTLIFPIVNKRHHKYANALVSAVIDHFTELDFDSIGKDIVKNCDVEHANKLAQAVADNITVVSMPVIRSILGRCDIEYVNKILDVIDDNIDLMSKKWHLDANYWKILCDYKSTQSYGHSSAYLFELMTFLAHFQDKDNFLLTMFRDALSQEAKDAPNNYVVLYHGMLPDDYFRFELYTRLCDTLIDMPKEWLFLRFFGTDGHMLDGLTKNLQNKDVILNLDILNADKRQQLLRGRDYQNNVDYRALYLFVNSTLFGCHKNSGSCTANYVRTCYTVHNCGFRVQELMQALGFVGDEFKNIVSKLEELQVVNRKLSAYGRLLQLAIPEKNINELAYPASIGGPLREVVVDGKPTTDMAAIIAAYKRRPIMVEDSDNTETVVLLTCDGVLNLKNPFGVKMRVYHPVNQKEFAEFQRQYDDVMKELHDIVYHKLSNKQYNQLVEGVCNIAEPDNKLAGSVVSIIEPGNKLVKKDLENTEPTPFAWFERFKTWAVG